MRATIVMVAFCLAIVPAIADESVRVYTNADLLKYGPPPDPVVQSASDDDLGWDYVADFIEREHARLEKERRHELDRQVVDARVDELDRRSRRTGIALPYYYSYRGHGGFRGNRRGTGFGSSSRITLGHVSAGRSSGLSLLHQPIVPLHARRPLDRPRVTGPRRGRGHFKRR